MSAIEKLQRTRFAKLVHVSQSRKNDLSSMNDVLD
jgi:hypothetical protein